MSQLKVVFVGPLHFHHSVFKAPSKLETGASNTKNLEVQLLLGGFCYRRFRNVRGFYCYSQFCNCPRFRMRTH